MINLQFKITNMKNTITNQKMIIFWKKIIIKIKITRFKNCF